MPVYKIISFLGLRNLSSYTSWWEAYPDIQECRLLPFSMDADLEFTDKMNLPTVQIREEEPRNCIWETVKERGVCGTRATIVLITHAYFPIPIPSCNTGSCNALCVCGNCLVGSSAGDYLKFQLRLLLNHVFDSLTCHCIFNVSICTDFSTNLLSHLTIKISPWSKQKIRNR